MSSFGYSVLGFGSFANRAIKVSISSDVNNPDIDGNSYFGATAWASGTPKVLTITSGTTVGNLVIPGSMGGTLTVINEGDIHGSSGSAGSANSGSGGNGGVAITSASSFIYKGASGSNLLGGGGGGGGGGKAGNTSVTNNTYVRQPSTGSYHQNMGYPGYHWGIRNNRNQTSGLANAVWNGSTIAQSVVGSPYVNAYYHSPHGYTYYRGGIKYGTWNYSIYRAGTFSSTANYTGGAGGAGGVGAGYGVNAASGSSGTDGPGPAGTGGTGGTGGALGAAGSTGGTGGTSGSSGGSGGSAGASVTFSSGSITLAQDDGTITPDP